MPPYLRDVEPSACWNASKMICCLSGEMPMPVSVTAERDDLVGAREILVVRRPAAGRRADRERHRAFVRELERVRQQVLDDLLHALDVREHRARHVRIELHLERDLLRLGDVAERALDVALQIEQPQLADVGDDGSRLDLREIEDVVDQREQVVARGVDRLGRLDLPQAQVALGILRELVREEQQAVQRRAQLVRHVREELGLVLRGQRELRRLLFERLPRLLDLRVLALDLLVLVRELARLLLERLVRLLQLLGERLRLRQQVLRSRCSPRSC